MTWKAWLHSIASAAIGGAASSLGGAVVAPDVFNFSSSTGWGKLGQLALFGAVVPVLALLRQSPLPSAEITTTTTASVKTTVEGN